MALVNKNNKEAEANAMEITDLKAYQKLLKKNRKRCDKASDADYSKGDSEDSGK